MLLFSMNWSLYLLLIAKMTIVSRAKYTRSYWAQKTLQYIFTRTVKLIGNIIPSKHQVTCNVYYTFTRLNLCWSYNIDVMKLANHSYSLKNGMTVIDQFSNIAYRCKSIHVNIVYVNCNITRVYIIKWKIIINIYVTYNLVCWII